MRRRFSQAPAPPAERSSIFRLTQNEGDLSIAELRRLLSTPQREFPVIDAGGHLKGVLMRDGMVRALTQSGPETPVLDVMVRDIPVVNARAPLSAAVELLQSGGQPIVGVVDDAQRIGGIVTPENLAEYLMASKAGRGRQKAGSGGQ